MLALLDDVTGVRDSRIDHSGRYFLLELEPGADAARVVEGSRAVLEDARRPDERVEDELVLGFRRGETWLRADETIALSREEARILAERDGNAAAREIGLDERKTRDLVRVTEEEIAAAFDRIHAAGRGLDESAQAEFARAGERVVERSRAFLTAEEAERLRAVVAERLGR